ncbi:MAG TPA: LiaF domain-containing protein, partial [Kofleriaceae bacterium]
MSELEPDPLKLRVIMGSCERRGAWKVPARIDAHVMWGNMELDLREAELGPDTTIDAHVMMGNLEIIVPNDLAVDVNVDSVAGNVEQGACDDGGSTRDSGFVSPGDATLASHAYRDPAIASTRRL